MRDDMQLLCSIGAALLFAGLPAFCGAQTGAATPAKGAEISKTARPQLPPGQVFECLDNGRRIFSDAPCGPRASVRQLNDLNIMDRSTARPAAGYRSEGYRAAPLPAPAVDEPAVSDIASDPAMPEFIVARERARRDRLPRHDNHPHPHRN